MSKDEASPEGTVPDETIDNIAADEAPRQHKQPRRLPAFLDHINFNDLKILFRCCVAAWVASLLMFIQPSLREIGISTFFASLVLFIVPPAGILFVYLLASLSLLLGMCLAWAWGLLAMKAAYAARSDADTQSGLQALQQQAIAQAKSSGQNATAQDIAALVQIEIYNGGMLDARVTVVFYVMCCFFIYFLSRLRGGNPKLLLTHLFGTIVIDIVLLVGPLLPTFNGLLPQLLVKPGAIGIGIGTACCLLFFPQSTSYVVLRQMEQLIRMLEAPLDATRKGFTSDRTPIDVLLAAKGSMISVYKAMEPNLAFLPLDFSRGRWSADDVKSLNERVRLAMLSSASLLDFHAAVHKVQQKTQNLKLNGTHYVSDDSQEGQEGQEGKTATGRRDSFEGARLVRAFTAPEERGIRETMTQALGDTTAEVLETCSKAIKLAADSVHNVNNNRWIRQPPQKLFDDAAQQLEETLATLRATREDCVKNTTEAVLMVHAELFDENGDLKEKDSLEPHHLNGIMISMVIEERILSAAKDIEDLLEHVLYLSKLRERHRIWLPTRIQYAASWLMSGSTSIPVAGTSPAMDEDPDVVEEQSKEVRHRLKLIRGYQSPVGRSAISRIVVGFVRWLFNPSGMFALRMVIATIATAIPAAIPHSAGFFYREKGIWAVITAQTCLLFYMSEFTFSLVARLFGTIVGGVLALVAWYIGSGDGGGNPYGLAASTAVVIVVCMWLRLFLPPAYAAASIMGGATFTLIVGFSYDNEHTLQYGLPGIGYISFWKRLVTVLLGFIAAAIVQMFPKPPSATTHVSKTLANTVRTLSDHYALLLSHWSRTDQRSPVGSAAQSLSIEVAEDLFSLNGPIALLPIDLSISPLDQKTLREVQAECHNINQALGRLLSLSASLTKELQDRLVETAGLLDDRSISNIMAVMVIVEQSLRTGAPLPERLPVPLVRTCFEAAWYGQHHKAQLSTSLVRDENYRTYCVAISSYLKFLRAVDNLVVSLKATLGECHVIHPWEDEV